MKIKAISLLSIAALAALSAHAQSVPAPQLSPGDTWNYVVTTENGPNGWRQNHDQIVLLRKTSSQIYFEIRPAGSTLPPTEAIAGADWSRARDINGTQTTVNRPLAFPLEVGKTWEVKYTEAHPNPKHDSETFDNHFKVIGKETVEVPAGKFDAIKIEAEGQWTAHLAPMQSATSGAVTTQNGATVVVQTRRATPGDVSGQLYKAFWYVPEIGRWVKSVEEYYASNGVRTQRISTELESFKHAVN